MDTKSFTALAENIVSLEIIKAVHIDLMNFLKDEMTVGAPSKSKLREPRLSDFYRRSNKKFAFILPISGFIIGALAALAFLMFGKYDPSLLQMSNDIFKPSLLIMFSLLGAALGYGAYFYYVYQRKITAKKKFKNALDAYYATFTKENHSSSSQSARVRTIGACLEKLFVTESASREALMIMYNKSSLPFNARNSRSICVALEQCAERGSVGELAILAELSNDDTYICGKYEEYLTMVESTVRSLKNSFRSTGSLNEIEKYTEGCMKIISQIS